MFDTTGQLFFPAATWGGVVNALNPEHPYWIPEFIGDTIVVNGKAWPFVNVAAEALPLPLPQRLQRAHLRALPLNPATGMPGPAMWVIGTDGGYLDSPQAVDPALGGKLVIMPGERYEVIIDFAGLRRTPALLLRNTGRTPYPGGPPPGGSTLGQIVQFRVGAPPRRRGRELRPGARRRHPRRGPDDRPARQPAHRDARSRPRTKIRQLTLNEVMGMADDRLRRRHRRADRLPGRAAGGPGQQHQVDRRSHDGRYADDAAPTSRRSPSAGQTTWFSELPQEGETELWEIVNITADAHPIHLHLVQFQLLNRQDVRRGRLHRGLRRRPSPAGVYCPATARRCRTRARSARALPLDGGNPDVTRFLQNGVQLAGARRRPGWKDTILVPPGMVTRFVVRWAPTSQPVATPPAQAFFPFDPNDGGLTNYVWHCHIIDHEDNEMMRPTSGRS